MAKSGRPQDSFGDKAKKEGFAARSVYKLEEIDRRSPAVQARHACARHGRLPGLMDAVRSPQSGREGHVLAVDQQEWRGGFPPQVETRQCDVLAR